MSIMIKAYQPANGMTAHIVAGNNMEQVNAFCTYIKAANAESKVFKAGQMPLSELPEEIQNKVKSTLKAFNKVTVVYEYGKFSTSVGCCIKSHYNYDHFVCGEYKAEEVYTEEERRQNYKECFGC